MPWLPKDKTEREFLLIMAGFVVFLLLLPVAIRILSEDKVCVRHGPPEQRMVGYVPDGIPIFGMVEPCLEWKAK